MGIIDWIMVNYPTIIVVAFIIAIIVVDIVFLVRKKKKIKNNCSCGCEGCAYYSGCSKRNEKK